MSRSPPAVADCPVGKGHCQERRPTVEHFGIDLHQKHSEICGLEASGKVKIQERVATSEAGLRKVFGKRKSCRVVLESGGQSSWAARVLGEMGHEVVVVNPRRIRLIAESSLKTDRIDAEILARLGRQEDSQLRPVYQRSEGALEARASRLPSLRSAAAPALTRGLGRGAGSP